MVFVPVSSRYAYHNTWLLYDLDNTFTLTRVPFAMVLTTEDVLLCCA